MFSTVPATGQVLRHYRILEQIGAGGMGVVYRAHDERLDRDVALKVLPPGLLTDESSRKRFRNEALALAKLNHANIATIHDFDNQNGLDFLIMEYVVGVSLATKLKNGALPEKELLDLAEQITRTLEDAHERGIIHRDLKPGNIMVTAKGQVKLLDFGLAKLLPAGGAQLDETLTETLQAVGTLPYMAPEQLRGDYPDFRSDIYAAGAVLYEMATGRRPFEEKTSAALASDILNKPPVPPGRSNPALSPKLEEIILKCMEKDADNRYQSAKELTVDLRRLRNASNTRVSVYPDRVRSSWLRASTIPAFAILCLAALIFAFNAGGWRDRLLGGESPGRVQSLAVLPLENLSRDPDQEYFTDGMTDELITVLGHVGALKVISRTSVMHYKSTSKTVPEIARELHVDAILQGAVLRSGNRARVTVQLTDGVTDRNLWAQSYERNLEDVLGLQDDVARSIAGEIQARLTAQEQTMLSGKKTVNSQAHENYLKGRFYLNKWTPEGDEKASGYFQEALTEDPNYAAAYAGLADSYTLLGYYGISAPNDVFPRAKAAAQKALELDDTLSEAHTSLALILANYDWDWARSEQEYKRALELNPSSVTAHIWYSFHLVYGGNFSDAIIEARRAQELDPLSLVTSTTVANILYDGGKYDEAIEQNRRVLELDSGFRWAHHSIGEDYIEKGMFKEGIAELTLGLDPERRNPHFLGKLAYGMARAGDRSGALKIVNDLERQSKQRYIPPSQIAAVYAALGDKEQAMAWLEKGYQLRDSWLPGITVDAPFNPLHADPHFREFVQRFGLRIMK
jgi:serine/threonine protein kinase/tetratricopeptide (TPR) repeat protein